MVGKLERVFVLIGSILFLLAAPAARAEPGEWDQRIRQLADKKPDAGLIFMEVLFFEDGSTTPNICQKIWVTALSTDGKKGLFFAQNSPTLFGHAADSSTYGGWAVLEPGVYDIAHLWCEGGGRFVGPFARFAVQRGQVLNLGALEIAFKRGPLTLLGPRKNTGDWRIEDLSQRAVATFRKLAPEAFAKATKKHMIAVRVKPRVEQGAAMPSSAGR